MREGDRVAASIVVCTRDRAEALRATLAALGTITVPAAFPAEVLIVDNGSRDATATIAQAATLPHMPVRYLCAARPGVANARNAGMAAARGDIIVFLDDDVRPPTEWLPQLCAPILEDRADAVAGGVRLAADRLRPWMEPLHRAWLAATEYIDPLAPQEFVSANAAFHRRVLDRVPRFDPELGPGCVCSQGEDALFSWQVVRAGFRLVAALEVAVEHHLDIARLTATSFRRTARGRGRTLAYVRHHWEHGTIPYPARQLAGALFGYARHRLRDGTSFPSAQLLALERVAFLTHWRGESRRPRRYDRFGLVTRPTAP